MLIFGNSGSGKSTLAKKLSIAHQVPHLDLDTLAWKPVVPPQRRPLEAAEADILNFIGEHSGWVIEGCYSDLLEIAIPFSDEVVFMNLPVELCIENARNRPWEPHKYESLEAQNSNLNMLIDWIAQYPDREDTFSEASHTALYENYDGKKRMVLRNE